MNDHSSPERSDRARGRPTPRRDVPSGPPAWRLALLVSSLCLGSCAPWAGGADGAEGLADHEVEILRDDWGVPHIYARSEAAGYFGLGYAQAEDQGERFLRMILTSIGRLATVDGAEAVANDIDAHRWMHPDLARQAFGDLSAHVRSNYTAYADGFNAFLGEHPDRAPAWRFEIEPWHLIAVPRRLLWNFFMVNQGLRDCLAAGVPLEHADLRALDVERALASNEWVLHPERTADSAMIVLSDPHGPIDGGIFYEYRIHAGKLESAGFAIGGMMLLAHTRHLSWGQTTGAPDVSDCYAVETEPGRPLSYRFDREQKEMSVREIAIPVLGGDTVRRTVAYTNHNGVPSPVIARAGTIAYVVSTPYMRSAEAFDEEIDRLNHAASVDEARTAMRDLGMYPNNVMFGDARGSSWYVRAGRAPRRPDGFDWQRPVPGNTSASAWLGLHPIEDLVQAENPPQGYMQNNNLSPDRMTLPPHLIDPGGYPAYLFNDEPGRVTSRGIRAMELLAGAAALTIEQAQEIALDEKWPATEAWLTALAAAASPRRLADWSAERREMLREILAFDGQARSESSRALKYYLWREAVFEQLGREGSAAAVRAQWTKHLGEVVPAAALLAGIARAAATMMDLYGRLDASLGEFARIRRLPNDLYGNFSEWSANFPPIDQAKQSHPVGGITIPGMQLGPCSAGPCEQTLRAFGVEPHASPRKQVEVISGSRVLRLVAFTDPIQSFTLHHPGQSDDPASPHYDDQARLLVSGRRLKPVYFERSELEGHVERRVTLVRR